MQILIPVIKDAVVAGLLSQAARPRRRADLAGMGLLALSGLIFFLALIYAAFALHTVLDVHMSAQAAFAIVGLGLALVSLALGGAGLRILRRQEHTFAARTRNELRTIIDSIADDILPDIMQPLKESPKTALVAAALAGFMAGEKIH